VAVAVPEIPGREATEDTLICAAADHLLGRERLAGHARRREQRERSGQRDVEGLVVRADVGDGRPETGDVLGLGRETWDGQPPGRVAEPAEVVVHLRGELPGVGLRELGGLLQRPVGNAPQGDGARPLLGLNRHACKE